MQREKGVTVNPSLSARIKESKEPTDVEMAQPNAQKRTDYYPRIYRYDPVLVRVACG